MINFFKKFLFYLSLIALISLPTNASLLWNIQDGIREYNNSNYNDAGYFFADYINSNPNDKYGYYYLGKIYLKLKNNNQAQKNFEKSYILANKEKETEKIKIGSDKKTLQDYFDMAAMYFENGNLEEADYYADIMLKLNVKSSNAWFVKAKIANSRNEKELAKEYLNNAITYNSKLLETNLAKELDIHSIPETTKEIYNLFALEAYYKGNIENAINNYKKSLELDETNYEIYNALANLYLLNNEIENANEAVSKAKKINRQNIETYLIESKIYNLKNIQEKRKESLLKAYSINPNNIEMLLELGNFYLEKKDYKNAKKYFEALINTNDSLYEGYFGYILCLIEEGNSKKALNYIRKAISINQSQSETNYLLALICYKQGQMKEARDYITEAIEKCKNPYYYLLKAKIDYIEKKWNSSVNALTEAKKLNIKTYDKSEIDEYLLRNYIKTENYQIAEYYLNSKDLKLDKNSILYKYILYEIYKYKGNNEKANLLLNKIKKTKIKSVQECCALSEILLETDSIENAIEVLDKYIEKNPSDYNLYSQKIKIYLMAKKYKEIKEILNKIQKVFN